MFYVISFSWARPGHAGSAARIGAALSVKLFGCWSLRLGALIALFNDLPFFSASIALEKRASFINAMPSACQPSKNDGSSSTQRQYFSTAVSVLVALIVGSIEALGFIADRAAAVGEIWGIIRKLNGPPRSKKKILKSCIRLR